MFEMNRCVPSKMRSDSKRAGTTKRPFEDEDKNNTKRPRVEQLQNFLNSPLSATNSVVAVPVSIKYSRIKRPETHKEPTLNNDYIYSVLTNDYESHCIIHAYNTDVDNNFRSNNFKRVVLLLCKRIINMEFNHGRHVHEKRRFLILGQQCCDLFPVVYTLRDWYRPSIGSDHATGFLRSAHKTLKELTVSLGLYQGLLREKKSSQNVEETQFMPVNFNDKVDVDDEILNNWNMRLESRKKDYLDLKEVTLFFNKHAMYLKFPSSLQLLNNDFNILMGANAQLFEKNWPSVSQTIKEYCRQEVPEIYDKYKTVADDVNVLSLIFLCDLIEFPSGKKIFKNRHPRVKQRELVLKSILMERDCDDLEYEEITEIRQEIKNIYETCAVEKVDPVIVICGNFNNIKKVFIVVDNRKLQAPTIMDALNVYFKIFHIMKITKSNLNGHILQFIKFYIFNEHFNPYKSVETFCNKLNRFQLRNNERA